MTTKRLQIDYLLNNSRKSGSDFTSTFSDLGNGSMGTGVVELWKDGQINGFIKGTAITSIVFTAGIGAYALIKTKIAEFRFKQAVKELMEENQEEVSLRHAKQIFVETQFDEIEKEIN